MANSWSMSNGFCTNANAESSYDWIAEPSDVVPDMTTISVSGACSLIRRMTSNPDSAPSARSTSATSKFLWPSAASVSASDVAPIAR